MRSNLVKSIIARKSFSYSKDGITLDFSLRVDNTSELKKFKACLASALEDINEVLKGMKN